MFEGLTDENLANIDRLAMEAHLAPDSGMNRNDEVMGVLERVCQSFDQSFQVSYAQEGGKEAYRTRIINAWRD